MPKPGSSKGMMKFVQTPRRVSSSDWVDVTSSGRVELQGASRNWERFFGRTPVFNDRANKGG
ncbi:hypothetical protein N7539_005987 [Penicillium diatomitis]|uniref:Uncharacterized protein n=1 Tax=Penicillium diatomitis TaxID=2819901 RepID=A0A9W9X5L6_9EURO|nr:uncharacterized protein N7539_005987 [Penicillium diatomitis]KAJ5484191.1 hypothetical protein N7539_005987 [Penicillium diatomitis]